MNHAINCEISEKLSANCTCGVDVAVPVAQVPPSINGSGSEDDDYEDDMTTCEHCNGTGGDPWDDGISPCEACDGEGYKWWL